MRLIDADKLDICDGKCRVCARDRGTDCENLISCSDVIDIINDAPTVDPVKHGRWVLNRFGEYDCSVCKSCVALSEDWHGHPRYCSVCGAKMEVSE